jgi:serine/threonine-protein kinase
MSSKELPKTIGRYEVRSLIGSGAMGRVLLAHDPVLERDVAIKLLRNDLAIGSDVRDSLLVRMRHEARAAARVTHPNLVVLHDMGEDSAVGLFLVFEYLEGQTLKQRIAERRLSAPRAAKLSRELGSALTFAHSKGVLHRDVKPDNIVLTPTGAKIADFGIARIPDSTLTGAGGLLGTPAYSAPETFHGGKFSPRSDQFSLAATLYEAISGKRAFPGDDAVGVATKIMNEPAEDIAKSLGYANDLDAVLARALAKSPEDRFETCDAFTKALAEALGGSAKEAIASKSAPSTVEPASTAKPASGLASENERKPWRMLVGGVGVVIVSALLVRAFVKNQQAASEPAVPPAVSSTVESAAPPRKVAGPAHQHPAAPASVSAPSPQQAQPPPSAMVPSAEPSTAPP